MSRQRPFASPRRDMTLTELRVFQDPADSGASKLALEYAKDRLALPGDYVVLLAVLPARMKDASPGPRLGVSAYAFLAPPPLPRELITLFASNQWKWCGARMVLPRTGGDRKRRCDAQGRRREEPRSECGRVQARGLSSPPSRVRGCCSTDY